MSDIRVLVVDEDPDVLNLTRTFLEREDGDLDVRTEQDPLAAVDRVAAEDIDCVVTDLRMPDLDGFELQERVADREASESGADESGDRDPVPFILFTAAADQGTRERAEASDVDGLILKGTGTEHYAELAHRIRELAGAAEE